MREALEALSGLFLSFAALNTLFLSFFIWIVKKPTKNPISLLKAGVAALVVSLCIYSLSLLAYALPKIHTLLGFNTGFILSLFSLQLIIKGPLRRTWNLHLLNIFAQVLTVIIGTSLWVGGLSDLWKIL